MGALAPLRIEGPPPVAPRFGLVTTPGTIVPETDEHWTGGVRVDAYPDELPSRHYPCSTGTNRQKETGNDPPSPEFASFTVYLPVTCGGLGISDEAGAELLRNRARQVFAAVESFGVEQELMFGGGDIGSTPSLVSEATVLNGTGVGPREALALLENAIGETGRQGMVHVDPATFVAMDAFGLFHDEGDRKVTNRGNTVIVGDGYIGAVPDADQEALTADQAWAFATGPVRLTRDEIFVATLRESFDHETNQVTFRAERNYVAYWDTALTAAVLVDRSSTP